MKTNVSLKQAKENIFSILISCEVGSYMAMYAPEKTVVTISNLVNLTGYTRYFARKALKSLIEDGLVEYTSQGCPAVVSYGEYEELVAEAGPPINGYTLTDKGFKSEDFQTAYAEWSQSMADWANGSISYAG